MTTIAPLEIKVVFDASARRRPGSGVKPAVVRSRHERSRAWTAVAALNLIVAFAMYYAIWWKADPEIYLILMMKTPMQMDLDAAAGIFVPSSRPRELAASVAIPSESGVSSYDAPTSQRLIPTAAYGWLALATMATCAMGLSAGAAGVRGGGPHWRTFGWIASAMLLLGLGVAVYGVWTRYGVRYPPNHLRLGMAGLLLLSTALGLAIGRGARGLSRLAAVCLVLAAVGTVVALYLGAKTGAIEPRYTTANALAAAFAAHSAYGWLLLLVTWRLSR